MPYDVDNPPEKVRGLSANKQRQWVEVFNSCFEKNGDDVLCSKEAWGVTGGWRDKQNKSYTAEEADVMRYFISEQLGAEITLKGIEVEEAIDILDGLVEEIDDIDLDSIEI